MRSGEAGKVTFRVCCGPKGSLQGSLPSSARGQPHTRVAKLRSHHNAGAVISRTRLIEVNTNIFSYWLKVAATSGSLAYESFLASILSISPLLRSPSVFALVNVRIDLALTRFLSIRKSVWQPADSAFRELTSSINSGASNVHRSQTC